MTVRLNAAFRTNMIDGVDTDFDSGNLSIYTGAQPALASDAPTGTLIVSITLPADAFTAPSAGAITKQGTWSAVAGNPGTPGWFRLRNAADTVRLDGAIPAEMTLGASSILAGDTIVISTGSVTVPAQP